MTTLAEFFGKFKSPKRPAIHPKPLQRPPHQFAPRTAAPMEGAHHLYAADAGQRDGVHAAVSAHHRGMHRNLGGGL